MQKNLKVSKGYPNIGLRLRPLSSVEEALCCDVIFNAIFIFLHAIYCVLLSQAMGKVMLTHSPCELPVTSGIYIHEQM
jgi:hypothetical protein